MCISYYNFSIFCLVCAIVITGIKFVSISLKGIYYFVIRKCYMYIKFTVKLNNSVFNDI